MGAHFCPPFGIDFVLDDWGNHRQALAYADTGSLLRASLTHHTRPVSVTLSLLAYRFIGETSWIYAACSMAGHALCLAFVVGILWLITRRWTLTWAAGCLFVLLPTVSELFYFIAPVTGVTLGAMPLYLGSAYLWLLHSESGRARHAVGSALCFAGGLFAYEIGFFLPVFFAFSALLKGRGRRALAWLLPHAGCMVLYAAWRLTGAFGLTEHTYWPTHLQVHAGPLGWMLNTISFLRWWIGVEMGRAVVNGLDGFMAIPPAMQRIHQLLAILLAAWAVVMARSCAKADQSAAAMPGRQAWLLAMVWVASCFLPLMVSYSVGRLMYLPGVGVALMAALVVVRFAAPAWPALLAGLVLVLLPVHAGSAFQWLEAGQFHRGLYGALEQRVAQDVDRPYWVFDTSALRARSTRGLLTPVSNHPDLAALYGNAGLLRGFAPRAMLERLRPEGPRPTVLLDYEHNVRRAGDRVIWHERYGQQVLYTARVDQVLFIDVLNAAHGGGGR